MKRSTWLIILAAVVLIAGISAVYFFRKQTPNKTTVRPAISATPTQKPPSPSATPTIIPPTASPTVPAENDEELVKQAYLKKHEELGRNPEDYTVQVTYIDSKYAAGTAQKKGPIAEGSILPFYAAKVKGTWDIFLVVTASGITCDQLSNYPDFPSSVIPNCYDKTTQESVTR